jgi:hypothetical protein
MQLWIGLAAIVVGLLLAAFAGGIRNTFGSFRGNLAQKVKGNVTQTYTEAAEAKPPPEKSADGQERFIKWSGLIIAFAGFVVAAIKLWIGK